MAKIYRIVGDNGVYVGSTIQPLKRRFNEHMCKSNKCESKQLINPKIELIEEVDETDRYIREQYWIDRTECINYRHAPREIPIEEYQRQYRQDNRELLAYKSRQYNQQHKDKISAHRNQDIKCECGTSYTLRNKARHLRTAKHLAYLSQN